MIPNVFVSSTIADLHHLRDTVREAIGDLSFNPIMSEYGDIGYIPALSVDEACQVAIRQCQLAVLMVGKRYGSVKSGLLSVTHQEFRAARDAGVPLITLVDADVWAYRAVFEANQGRDQTFPGMDSPGSSFLFLQEIVSSPTNNGILPYRTAADARLHIKRQIAHLVGELLRARNSSLAPQVRDILAEVRTLRHEIGNRTQGVDHRFLRLMRYLLDPSSSELRNFIEFLYDGLDPAGEKLLSSRTLDELVAASGWTLAVGDALVGSLKDRDFSYFSTFGIDEEKGGGVGTVLAKHDGTLVLSERAAEYLRAMFKVMKDHVDRVRHGIQEQAR